MDNSKRWHEKLGESAPSGGDGHWRTLQTGSVGHDQTGNEVQGKTWVQRNRLLQGVTPKSHQKSFAHATLDIKTPQTQGILAIHGTGTGKTLTAVNAFEELKGAQKAKRALVVTPAGLRTNFLESGVRKFTSSEGTILDHPQELPPNVEYVVASYDSFRRNPEEWVDKVKPDVLITDELQKALNEDSVTYDAVMKARKRVPYFMGLTGSPTSNKPSELVPLLQIATAGTHPIQTQAQFNKMFMQSQPAEQKGIFGGKTRKWDFKNVDKLRKLIGPSIHYVEDLDASQKPIKLEEKIPVTMSPDQIELYRMSMKGIDPKIIEKIKRGEQVSDKEAMNIFTRLQRARQVSNSLHVVQGISPAEAAEKTPKVKKLLDDAVEHLKTTPDGQVIMYTNLVTGGVDVLSAGLQARGIPFGVFAGRGNAGMTEEVRQQAVKDYQAGKKKAIIITGAGAEGLSLGNTTLVQVLDGHYNPQRTAQAVARGIRAGGLAHRPQAERKVQVKKYVSTIPRSLFQKITFRPPENSVEQWVYQKADQKDELNQKLRRVMAARSDEEEKKRNSISHRIMDFMHR